MGSMTSTDGATRFGKIAVKHTSSPRRSAHIPLFVVCDQSSKTLVVAIREANTPAVDLLHRREPIDCPDARLRAYALGLAPGVA